MSTTIFDEIRVISSATQIHDACDILESGKLEIDDAKNLAAQVIKAILPACPPGRRYNTESVWSALATWGANALCSKDRSYTERKAAWLRMRREWAKRKGAQYPAKPIFMPALSLPQPVRYK